MSRYINADAALKRFEEMHGNESDLLNCYNADWIVSFIETQPTVDVQEVRRGYWLLVDGNTGVFPFCHRQDRIDPLAKYCRYCGAGLEKKSL